jgi:uncharacterized SAM-binding protein YcdF (DUF218 family)
MKTVPVSTSPLDHPASPDAVRRAGWGLLSRRTRWGLSARGWLFAGAGIVLAGISAVHFIYPFLAVTERIPADNLVVEGWVQNYAIRAATGEFAAGGYLRVFTTGGPLHGISADHHDFDTAASAGAQRLVAEGVPPAAVQMVPALTSVRDRTYGSALALRTWLQSRDLPIRRLNVLTEDVHARRTRLLFQRAFGDAVTVGIISIPNPDYDAKHWWRYSEGVRDVLGETIAYVYARFLFFPPAPPAAAKIRPPNENSTHPSSAYATPPRSSV